MQKSEQGNYIVVFGDLALRAQKPSSSCVPRYVSRCAEQQSTCVITKAEAYGHMMNPNVSLMSWIC